MPNRRPIQAGEQFGRLTVTGPAEPKPGKYLIYRVAASCSCGNSGVYYESKLRYGSTQSCGCLNTEATVRRNIRGTTHGMTRTKPYVAWQTMRDRCANPKNPGFPNYGGRGIKVCKRWQNSFEAFLEDMGPGESHLTLDRIDPNGDYEPTNCRWATWKTQETNRRNNRFVVVAGKRLCVSDAARVLDIDLSSIGARAKRTGCTYQEAADYFAWTG